MSRHLHISMFSCTRPRDRIMAKLTSPGSIKQGQPVLMDAWESMANAPQKTRRRSTDADSLLTSRRHTTNKSMLQTGRTPDCDQGGGTHSDTVMDSSMRLREAGERTNHTNLPVLSSPWAAQSSAPSRIRHLGRRAYGVPSCARA